MATIRDVARVAGVSIATVSRVFNDNSLVNEETATRVMAAATSVDYWPNGAAKSLTTRRTNTIGVLLPDLFGEFYSEVIRGIDHLSRRHEYQLLLSSSHSSSEAVLAACRAMLGRVDGLIVMAQVEALVDTVERISRRIPVVLLNPRDEMGQHGAVAVDNLAGATAAVEHLLALGHREIAMIAGPEGNADAERRLQGFRQALAAAGLAADRALVVPGDFRESGGFTAGQAILARLPRPTAVFAANDSMAIGLLAALRSAGCQVPRDLAVVGFDDIAIAAYLNPPLTTVSVDASCLGQQAVQMMLTALASGAAVRPVREVVPATLVIRQSCGARPAPQTDPHPPADAAHPFTVDDCRAPR